jgi:hypothetical protein
MTFFSVAGRKCRIAAVVAAATALSATPGGAQAATDAFLSVPRQEVPGNQIGWYVNQTLDAFTKAVENTKPLIVVFGEQSSPFTQHFAKFVTSCPQLNQLAGVAVFAYGSPPADEYARRMASHLKLTTYPTISVIYPRTDRLTEVHRLEGFFDAEAAADILQRALVSADLWPKGLAKPRKLPSHYLAYAGKACTAEGAKRLGIVR